MIIEKCSVTDIGCEGVCEIKRICEEVRKVVGCRGVFFMFGSVTSVGWCVGRLVCQSVVRLICHNFQKSLRSYTSILQS